jgi:hypothetical protein
LPGPGLQQAYNRLDQHRFVPVLQFKHRALPRK